MHFPDSSSRIRRSGNYQYASVYITCSSTHEIQFTFYHSYVMDNALEMAEIFNIEVIQILNEIFSKMHSR